MFFHLCEVVQIFQRESIFIIKLVPGGTNFGGSIFTMTGYPQDDHCSLETHLLDVSFLFEVTGRELKHHL